MKSETRNRKIEIKKTWWYGITPFCLFKYSKNKMTYTDARETNYNFMIGWFQLRVSVVNNA